MASAYRNLVGRARSRSRSVLGLSVIFALGLAACADEPTTPAARGGKGDRDPVLRRALGVVEITISGLGTDHVTSSAMSAPTVAELQRLHAQRAAGAGGMASGGLGPQDFELPTGTAGGDGTIQLELLSTGSFTHGERGNGGYRYLYATYRVRNAQTDGTHYDTSRQNLTFYAVDTDETFYTTAISNLKLFNGDAADSALASTFVPTGAAAQDARSGVVSRYPDVLQVITETEADEIQDLVGDGGVNGVFPYGFVVQNRYNPATRTLEGSPTEDQFDGVVTFAFKVPLQATPAQDPFTVSAMFLAVDDDEVKLTQSVEEQTPAGRAAFDALAVALDPDVITLLPPAGDALVGDGDDVRVLCDVRVAGPVGNPSATLAPSAGTSPWPVPSPFRAGRGFLPRDARLGAASCSSIASANPVSFAVHGHQSGRNVVDAYEGVGGTFVLAPAARGGAFFPGEEVEVTLTTALGGTKPVVARYRAAVSRGSGAFVEESIGSGGVGVLSMASGDVDGDGDVDLVMANASAYKVSVLRNQGNGSFATQSIDWNGVESVALGDLDGDGDLDLIVGYWGNSLAVCMNQGDGSFGPPASYQVGSRPFAIGVGDLDGNGDLDLAVVNMHSFSVTVLLNQGDGSFDVDDTYRLNGYPSSVAIGDVDGDGDLDLVAGNSITVDISVLLNRGDGRFDPQTMYYGAGKSVALGDVDGDGDLDVVASGALTHNIAVFPNRGDGTFDPAVPYSGGDYGYSVALGDLDGDGDLDLATSNYSAHTVTVLFNQGNGTFGSATSYAGGNYPWPVVVVDIDGDGDLDVVTANSDGAATVTVLRNR